MLTGFPPIFVADTKISYDSNFVAPLIKVKNEISEKSQTWDSPTTCLTLQSKLIVIMTSKNDLIFGNFGHFYQIF